ATQSTDVNREQSERKGEEGGLDCKNGSLGDGMAHFRYQNLTKWIHPTDKKAQFLSRFGFGTQFATS
ncbi:MAG TPA: hypothetical protein DCE78_10125, partial [Bacteroidetes bacterium]|nr:hypothetical protein [Bacteroidota bacterium]